MYVMQYYNLNENFRGIQLKITQKSNRQFLYRDLQTFLMNKKVQKKTIKQ